MLTWRNVIAHYELKEWHQSKSGIWTALCCFHGDSRPSLRMWPSGRFYCYGCGAGGNSIEEFFHKMGEDVSRLEGVLPTLTLPGEGQLPLPFCD